MENVASLDKRRSRVKDVVSRLHDKIRIDCVRKSKEKRQEMLLKHRAAIQQAGLQSSPSPADAALQERVNDEIRQIAREGAAFLLESYHQTSSSPASPPPPQSLQKISPNQASGCLTSEQNNFGLRTFQHLSEVSHRRGISGEHPECFTPPVTSRFNPLAGGRVLVSRTRGWCSYEASETNIDDILTEEEELSVLKLLEEQLYTTMIEAELEAMEEEQQRHLADMVAEYEAEHCSLGQEGSDATASSDRLLCPVCGKAYLVQLHGVIACPLERWQLDLRTESLTMEWLRERLLHAYEGHVQSNCKGRLHFEFENKFGMSHIVARCQICEMLHLIA
ncbi:hypothetical protein CEUSTIGMA_g7097.t1 [Chlamydomonas eustigma]|uniref:RPA-interacting protein C-terminal domain-containing protein n=1 Tax=Chlamydomonas eustigma TaxID=1157962 RepID=A0A250X9A8_9CHLO|nr:hypothetical protein CEUSTIGMA_g7097.t1 [Chlamydomonas eustigma]|eukprot:GAX79656.1 hypothetical protein CEUSTIGMA_g7097.t1 [Chlamydomonas eustigma]